MDKDYTIGHCSQLITFDKITQFTKINEELKILDHIKSEIEILERIKTYLPTEDEEAWTLICYLCNELK